MGPLTIGSVSFVILGVGIYTYIWTKRRKLREARRMKYAPDLPGVRYVERSTILHSKPNSNAPDKNIPGIVRTQQMEELTEKEYRNWEVRDDSRNENINSLQLVNGEVLEDLSSSDEHLDEEQRIKELEMRGSWIEENDEPLEEHATFVEREMIGSGVIIEESAPENDDLDIRLEREGGKSGSVQVSLAWDDYNDLDLHLFSPSGERIYFNNKNSECGGELDVDMNIKPVSNNPVENVVWVSNPPKGTYKVGVHFYKNHRKRNTKKTCKYRIRVALYGKIQEYSGMIKYGNAMQMVTGFTIGNEEESSKKYTDYDFNGSPSRI
jgi:hypothetical protein